MSEQQTYVPTGVWDVHDKAEVLAPRKELQGAALDMAIDAMPRRLYNRFVCAYQTAEAIQAIARGEFAGG